ncbi:hypothetical protein [Halothermothrix orenii]|uniref:hypothetical protein n=1 Tax=Halothermothrix orenii TaxID=31909 RepID=UPI001D045871|nr:hypothetical protein [Halothermothrix orenii]
MHGVDKIIDKEFELWYDYYHNQNMRHLFLELPYYTAEFLNIWMQSDSDDILNNLYFDWANTALCNPEYKEFFKKIKIHCPETIFHGTDIGHRYNSIGVRFLKYLRSNNLEDSEQYLRAKEVIEQGKKFYSDKDHVYRENMMVENFIREFDQLKGESIMGIYGAAHTGLEAMDHTNSVPCMANQLKERYGDAIHSVDLFILVKDIEPYRVDIIQVGGKEYEAMYFGKQELTGFKEDYVYREFWRLENAYEDFEDSPKTGYVMPYDNYPMLIETGQVFVIDYIKKDGSIIRKYFRSDGLVWENIQYTEEFIVE